MKELLWGTADESHQRQMSSLDPGQGHSGAAGTQRGNGRHCHLLSTYYAPGPMQGAVCWRLLEKEPEGPATAHNTRSSSCSTCPKKGLRKVLVSLSYGVAQMWHQPQLLLTPPPPIHTSKPSFLEADKVVIDTQITIPQVSTDHRYPEIHVELYFKNWRTLSLGVLVLVTTILTFVLLFTAQGTPFISETVG